MTSCDGWLRPELAHEKPGQTFDATALVHEAYIRLVDSSQSLHWDSRGHFFAAAAEAMRRILLNRARDKQRIKRGGERQRIDLDNVQVATPTPDDELLAVDEALQILEAEDRTCAELVKLRFYAGLSLGDAAAALDIPRRTADRHWAYARAWLFKKLPRIGRFRPSRPRISGILGARQLANGALNGEATFTGATPCPTRNTRRQRTFSARPAR